MSEIRSEFDDKSITGRSALKRRTINVTDVLANPDYKYPAKAIETYRSFLAVPVLKGTDLLGVISLYHPEVKPFTDRQVAVVETFAHQAVIAIENVRLFEAEQQRTRELRELLEQQTATSEVLQVISSSAGDLQPVFAAMLENAVRICGASFGSMLLFEGEQLRRVAMHNAPASYVEYAAQKPVIHYSVSRVITRLRDTKRPEHTRDLLAEDRNDPLAKFAGARTVVSVPMLKHDELIGLIAIYRREVRPFADKQVELVANFAAQAVIAIENARLLTETREALEKQIATAEVLGVINSSSGELAPVFEAIASAAAPLCDAANSAVFRFDGSLIHLTAQYGLTAAQLDTLRDTFPLAPGRGSVTARAIMTGQVVHVPDLATDVEFAHPSFVGAGLRGSVSVPMLREDVAIGAITVTRQESRSFTDKQIALLENFAAQAVIAIENARLLSKLRELLEQQTATSDILASISGSLTDPRPVFNAIVHNLRRLFGARFATVQLLQGETIEMPAADGEVATEKILQHYPRPLDNTSVGGQAMLTNKVVQHAPVLDNPVVPTAAQQMARDYQYNSTFAAQSAVAIQNARLFENVETRTRELARSLQDLRTAQDRLIQTEKLASLGQLTAGIAHEIKNPLNFVNNFSAVSIELIDELREALGGVHLDSKLRAEISEIADTLQGNLDKVVQHGKRADSIVKNMLLHSRRGSGEHRLIEINALVEESLNLAYHGARAEKEGFNITLERSFDPSAGEVDLFPQEITRVLLNLISNGFYAATKRKAETDGADYKPTLATATKNLGDRVEIRIRDNGTGIPPEVKQKMFNPFFTTKPASEGTGLGLSLSYDIIVKQHGGSIEVDTQPGAFSEFRIVLPRAGASLMKSGEPA